MVVYGHAWYLGGFGEEPIAHYLFNDRVNLAEIGVRGFFVLSGYLVLQSERRTLTTRDFLRNRAVRIYPGLWLCLFLTGIILPAAIAAWSQPIIFQWDEAWGYFWRNLILPRTQINIAGILAAVPKPGDLNGSLWTLPYELGCYVSLAAAGWIGLTRSRSILPWITGSAVLLIYWFDLIFPERAWFFKSTGRQLAAWFTCGALLALIPENKFRQHLNGGIVLAAVAGFILACFIGQIACVGPLAIAVIVLWLAWHLPFPEFEQKAGGDYSYGLYIYAYPVQQGLAHYGANRLGIAAFFAFSLLLTLPLAMLSWHLVEIHALRFKARSVAIVA